MPFPKNEVRKVCMHDTRALLWERSHSRCFGYPSEILSSDLMIAPTPQPSHRSTQRSSTWGSDARRGGTQSASFRRPQSQNALFRRMRFSSPGQTRRHLTESRSLHRRPHGEAHSALGPHGKP